MANNVKELMDTDWRVQASATLQADTNASGLILIDISALNRWAAGSKLALSKVFWSIGSGVATLRWNGTGGGGATAPMRSCSIRLFSRSSDVSSPR